MQHAGQPAHPERARARPRHDGAGESRRLEQQHGAHEAAGEQDRVDHREVRALPLDLEVHHRRRLPHLAERDDPGGEQARGDACERRLDGERERVVRTGRDRDDRRGRPPERDRAVRAVATEHDDGGTPDLAHRTRRGDRVAHVVVPGRDEVFDEVVELDGLGRTAHDARPVAQDDEALCTTLRRADEHAAHRGHLVVERGRGRVRDEPADVSSRGGVRDEADRRGHGRRRYRTWP